MSRRFVWRTLAVVAGVVLILGTIASLALTEFAARPPRRLPGPEALRWAAEVSREWDSVEIRGRDGVPLRAWFFRAPAGRDRTAMVIHGVADSRLGVVAHAKLLTRHGYDVLAPDMRAHGESGGEAAGYGLLETDDVRRWIDWLGSIRPRATVYALGESMGAAILLQTLPAEPRIRALVAESPFSTFREIAYDRLGQYLGLGSWFGRWPARPVVEAAFWMSRRRFGLDLDQVSPEDAGAASPTPVLLIHPTADSNVALRHSRRIVARRVQAGLAGQTHLWEVPGARHTQAISAQPKEFERIVVGWFDAR